MVALNQTSITDEITHRIMSACAERTNSEQRRYYLGMSGMYPCGRKVWNNYHSIVRQEFDGKTSRIFATGHSHESVIIKDLRMAGYTIDGQQLEFNDFDGKFSGHADGVIYGVTKKPHLLEIKTMCDKNFKAVQKQGVKLFKPEYYAQANLYCHYGKLERILFVIENKNNSDLYCERLHFDKEEAAYQIQRAKDIIYGDTPPDKKEENQACWLCPWRTNGMCDEPATPRKDLKSCTFCKFHIDKDVLPCAIRTLIDDLVKQIDLLDLAKKVDEHIDLPRYKILHMVDSVQNLHPEFTVPHSLLNIKGSIDALKLLDWILTKYAKQFYIHDPNNTEPVEITRLTANSIRHLNYSLKQAEGEYCALHDNRQIRKSVGCPNRVVI